jgi:type IV pilus assembly protein PilW
VTINPPVSTIPAGDANTDTLLVVYDMGNGEPQGNVITTSTSTTYTVQMPTSFSVGDKVISAPAACGTTNRTLGSITSVGVSTVSVASAQSGATLYNLGLTPSILAYAIRNQNLTVCDFLINDCGLDANKTNASIWIPIAANIVSLRAVYWQDTSSVMDGIPDSDGHTQILPTTACGWARASAINFALVARSDQYTKDPIAPTVTMVTNTAVNHAVSPFPVINAPTWVENATAPMVGATGTLGPDTALDEPWKHYRYKVFQAVTPIRNVAWMGVPTGC